MIRFNKAHAIPPRPRGPLAVRSHSEHPMSRRSVLLTLVALSGVSCGGWGQFEDELNASNVPAFSFTDRLNETLADLEIFVTQQVPETRLDLREGLKTRIRSLVNNANTIDQAVVADVNAGRRPGDTKIVSYNKSMKEFRKNLADVVVWIGAVLDNPDLPAFAVPENSARKMLPPHREAFNSFATSQINATLSFFEEDPNNFNQPRPQADKLMIAEVMRIATVRISTTIRSHDVFPGSETW